MPADGHGLLDLELHEPLDEKDALFAVAVGEHVLHAVGGHLLPLAGLVVLHVAGAFFVEVGLAQVVEQGNDGVSLLRVGVRLEKAAPQHPVDIEAVGAQPPVIGPMKAGGGRCGEEIRLGVQPVQQLFTAGAGDVPVENVQKLLALRHLTAPYPRGCP